MTALPGTWVARDAGGNGTTTRASRLAQAGLIVHNADGTVRTGVLADGLGPVVTGAAGMSYNIRKHVAVCKMSETNGVVLVPNDGDVSVSTDPAPGSNSRIDVIYVLQNHVTGDGATGTSNAAVFGVTKGSTSATPPVPAIPTGATELARVTVPSGTVATSGLTFTQGQITTANSNTAGINIVRAFMRADTTGSYSPGGVVGTLVFPSIPVASRVVVDAQGVIGFVASANQIHRIGFAVSAGTLVDPQTSDVMTGAGASWASFSKMAWVDIPANTAVTLTSTLYTGMAGGAYWGGVHRAQRLLPGEY